MSKLRGTQFDKINMRLIAPSVSVVIVLSVGDARADALETLMYSYVSPGIVFSGATAGEQGRSIGFEVSAGYFPKTSFWAPGKVWAADRVLNFGGFFRTQGYDTGDASWSRVCAGGQIGWGMLGLEAGWGHHSSYPGVRSETGLHLQPYLSLGVVYIGAQTIVPFAHGGEPTGFEVNVALKLPLSPALFALAGVGNVTGGGRPLLVDGQPRIAPLQTTAPW